MKQLTSILMVLFFGTLGLLVGEPRMAMSQNACVPPPTGLVAWWSGDGNANDVVGGNHGTPQNGVPFAPGIVGQAFHFDGVHDYVDVGSAGNLQPRTQSYSVEAWARTTALGGQEGRDIYGNNWAANTGVELRLNAANRPEFLSKVDGKGGGVAGSNTVNDGSWHHWVGVVDVIAGKMRLYIDGALDAEADYTVVDLDSRTASDFRTASYQIGARESDNFWDGDIDEVSFYNRALSASEIQALFEAGSAGKCAVVILVPRDGESIVTPATGAFRLAGRVVAARGLATLQFKGKRLDLGTEVAEMVTFSGSVPNYSFDTVVCWGSSQNRSRSLLAS